MEKREEYISTYKQKIEEGAQIVIKSWLRLKPWERLLIVTDDRHMTEAKALKSCAKRRGASVDCMIVEKQGKQIGVFFDENENIFDGYRAIIGATGYSIVTTLAAKRAIKRGSKFLSLPLHTNDGKSMLAYDFLRMDTKKSRMMAQLIMSYFDAASTIRVKTKIGTDLIFSMRGRKAGFFNGVVKDGRGYSSASVEVYVPIEEDKTEGTFMLDGSFGYIGDVNTPIKIILAEGRIQQIEEGKEGKKLQDYLDTFDDPDMYVASEFGIGLNSFSKCRGKCYIEDESAYGTFHIGFGRNLALGGIHEASGHFDLVSHMPDIYVDNRMIMQQGKIIVPEAMAY